MRKIKLFSFILIAIFCFSGCSSNSAVGEDVILQDVIINDNYFVDYGFEIQSNEITKRQTNEETKTDYIWLTVSSENEDFTYNSEYTLKYVLYNDGWLLEEFDEVSEECVYKRPEEITDDVVKNELSEMGYIDIVIENIPERDDGSVFLMISAFKDENFTRKEYSLTMNCNYYLHSDDWQIEIDSHMDAITLSDKVNNSVGEWIYTDGVSDYYINILDIDLESEIITFEYSYKDMPIGYGFGFNDPEYTTSSSSTPLSVNYNTWLSSSGPFSVDDGLEYIYFYLEDEILVEEYKHIIHIFFEETQDYSNGDADISIEVDDCILEKVEN